MRAWITFTFTFTFLLTLEGTIARDYGPSPFDRDWLTVKKSEKLYFAKNVEVSSLSGFLVMGPKTTWVEKSCKNKDGYVVKSKKQLSKRLSLCHRRKAPNTKADFADEIVIIENGISKKFTFSYSPNQYREAVAQIENIKKKMVGQK